MWICNSTSFYVNQQKYTNNMQNIHTEYTTVQSLCRNRRPGVEPTSRPRQHGPGRLPTTFHDDGRLSQRRRRFAFSVHWQPAYHDLSWSLCHGRLQVLDTNRCTRAVKQWMKKKHSERRKHCTLAVVRQSQNFHPVADPFPGGAGRPKFNQLEMVTTFTYRPSLVKIDARSFALSW